jgi:hypothetical protein
MGKCKKIKFTKESKKQKEDIKLISNKLNDDE